MIHARRLFEHFQIYFQFNNLEYIKFGSLVFDVVPLLRVNDDAKVFKQHHVVLKINNRLRRPGMNHLGRQLTIKHGTPTSSSQFNTKAQASHTPDL